MTKAVIVKTDEPMPSGGTLDAVRNFLFGCVKGLREPDTKAWNRFWKKIVSMEPGELFELSIVFPRNAKYHRKFFALLNVGFDAWEPGRKHKTHKGIPVVKSFESFRSDVLILAGHYEQSFDLDGRLKLVAKSIAFSKLDDAEFEEVYDSVAQVLLERVLTTYAGREELDSVVEKILEFGR